MLKPHLFLVCEKVIVDKNEMPSLIGVFNKMTTAVSGDVPSNAVAPKEWCIFTSWVSEPSDAGRHYTQIYRILYPNGEQFGDDARIELQVVPGKRHSQTIASSQGLPIGQSGLYTVESWVEENGKKIGSNISLQFEVETQKIEMTQKEVKA
jgi:hypothetical protein